MRSSSGAYVCLTMVYGHIPSHGLHMEVSHEIVRQKVPGDPLVGLLPNN